ncbi:AAA family ATPase [Polyangium jinanense]|uniref:AAA family ATPase n=1 Tax=Polyangium jinanense TaxID=2829994 RepID=A0A9X3X856_9BACT|nr:AAA family ATPase [Polyangium jinanense]MDC3956441.1 AAA family ATPase [Polyangium jinanense]MDC3985472.1 AAA family ATPase [Polyangium jinanense]
MHIRKIQIENIRCFGAGERGVHLDLSRPDGSLAGWTVFAGRNGTGKTTLLQAIALCLTGPSEARQLLPSFSTWLRGGAREGKVDIEFEFDDASLGEILPGSGGRFEAALFWERNGGREPVLQFRGPSIEEGVTGKAELLGPWKWDADRWFWCGYGPGRRLGGASIVPERGASHKIGRVATLFDEEKSLVEGLDWLRELYSDRLDLAERARNADASRKSELERLAAELRVLQENVIGLLNDGLLRDGMRVVEFNREGLWVEQGGVSLALHQLSGGSRSVVALVFDILRRMHECFGELRIEHDKEHNVITVPYEGVILIDEIESHLHVSWQQSIGFWLKRHFPNVQFLVTTHSPFVCQAADPNGLVRLAAPGEKRSTEIMPEETYLRVVNGGPDDAVLTDLFGLETVYSESAEELRSRISRLDVKLIRGTATAEEKEERDHLVKMLPGGGSAMVEQTLRKLEALG